MKHILTAFVEDKPGVLNRVASLFRRRGFNIESLTVGHTELKGISRMTIVVDTDTPTAQFVESNLYKLVNVIRVDDLTTKTSIFRDLAMIKVKVNKQTRGDVIQLTNLFRARIVDVTNESLVIEITGSEEKIDGLIDVLRPYGIIEMARTGIVAMSRGPESVSPNPPMVTYSPQEVVVSSDV